MSSVRTIFHSLIKEKAKECGFRHSWNSYYRVVGDVLQGFKLYSHNLHYTVRFGCYPLCAAMEKNEGTFENREINHLLPYDRDEFLYLFPLFGFDMGEMLQIWLNRRERFTEIAEQLAKETETYLLPQLMKIQSPKDGLVFEKYCHNARSFRGMGLSEEEAEKRFPLQPYIQCTWYIQMRDTQNACLYLQKWIDELMRSYEINTSNGVDMEPPDCSPYEKLYDMLLRGNSDELERYIADKERITLDSFHLKKI